MPLILYYMDTSPPVRSVDLVIHALGIQAEYKPVNFIKGEHFSPEFLKLNPLHTVPVIDDDGFILWESRAIMTYLVSKYGKDDSLYPKDLKKRAIVDQRLHYSNDVFSVGRDIAKIITSVNATSGSEQQLAKVKEAQENLETLLQGQKFMAGDSLTVADLSFITFVDLLEIYSPTGDKCPMIKAWQERCKSTIKDFDKVNKRGAEQLTAWIKGKLSQ